MGYTIIKNHDPKAEISDLPMCKITIIIIIIYHIYILHSRFSYITATRFAKSKLSLFVFFWPLLFFVVWTHYAVMMIIDSLQWWWTQPGCNWFFFSFENSTNIFDCNDESYKWWIVASGYYFFALDTRNHSTHYVIVL